MYSSKYFSEESVLHKLSHFLPAQAPLKDFVHHNTLHAFQNLDFFEGLEKASRIFGYKVTLTLEEYRELYRNNKIKSQIIDKVLEKKKDPLDIYIWKEKMISESYTKEIECRIGQIRAYWKTHFHLDLDSLVHPKIFRILANYLDQGISEWEFPVKGLSFFDAIKELEKSSISGFFKSKRVKKLLLNAECSIEELLHLVVGDEKYYEYYLFDQQFSHQGWSGMVASIERNPETLFEKKNISLKDLVRVELLLEIDALDNQFKEIWSPLSFKIDREHEDLFSDIKDSELNDVLHLWHEAMEWSYYDEVLYALQKNPIEITPRKSKSFQALFCIDDRECSLRRHLEHEDPGCETFGTPGFFNVEFFFQPSGGNFYTKLCPAPVTPKFLIKEKGERKEIKKESAFIRSSNSLLRGWLLTQIASIWSAYQLISNILNPKISSVMASSFKHMDKEGELTIDFSGENESNLQVGYKDEEMADRVEGLLKSIGLVNNFSSIVYFIGHGSSSVNNPHYSAYDCGACCGRPGSVNARVAAHMANKIEVREILKLRGIEIPEQTTFIGALHDTSRDEIEFFDTNKLSESQKSIHEKNAFIFNQSLDLNAKERARRFANIDHTLSLKQIHQKIEKRSVALFEPRPEYNHATNSLCIVGRRELTEHVFLDRRSFLNSYNPQLDQDGRFLSNILKAAAPVCGGINLEYFFSRVDNQKLGAGSKLPHNVMGLFGVANGSEGDLRPGLPRQMVEIHDPLRLMMIVEQSKEIILKAIKVNEATYEWFKNHWIHLISIDPKTREISIFQNEEFQSYQPIPHHVIIQRRPESIFEIEMDNLPVYYLEK